jgi:hypothetical protein
MDVLRFLEAMERARILRQEAEEIRHFCRPMRPSTRASIKQFRKTSRRMVESFANGAYFPKPYPDELASAVSDIKSRRRGWPRIRPAGVRREKVPGHQS